jgi:CheY-like chemotaxis protein
VARILVIEDNELVRETIKLILEFAGHHVVAAVDGQDGLDRFSESAVDLVLCDVFMPRKDGIETLKGLRQVSKDLPIVIMSGGTPRPLHAGDPANTDYLRMARQLGATRTIAKPFRSRDLTRLIEECLATKDIQTK